MTHFIQISNITAKVIFCLQDQSPENIARIRSLISEAKRKGQDLDEQYIIAIMKVQSVEFLQDMYNACALHISGMDWEELNDSIGNHIRLYSEFTLNEIKKYI